jgi:hypothetical protein
MEKMINQVVLKDGDSYRASYDIELDGKIIYKDVHKEFGKFKGSQFARAWLYTENEKIENRNLNRK